MKMKERINKLIFAVINIVIFMALLVTGTPVEDNSMFIQITIFTLAGIYIFINKKKLFTNWLDVLMFIFCTVPLIPLITGTAINREETFMLLVKMLSVYCLYFLLKHLIDTPKKIEFFINIIIFTATILVILRNR